MEYIAIGAFVGVVVFGLLFIVLGLKGGPWKLPGIGMAVCFALLIVSAALFARGSNNRTADNDSSGDSGISANAGLFDITLTVPADFLGEGMTQEQLDESAKEGNFKSATLNADGSATYIMSKSQHKELMEKIKQTIDDSLVELANSESTPNIVKIEANKDYTQYKVTINTEDVGLVEAFSSLALYLDSGMYHAFNGTQVDNVNIQYINEVTGKVIQEANSKDLGDAPSEPEDTQEVVSKKLSAEKIEHTEYIGKNGRMIIVLKNANSSIVPDFDVEITFFDANKNMVSVATDGHDAVLPDAEVVSIIIQTPEKFESYEVSIKASRSNSYENLSESLTIEDNVGESGVVARFTNNSEKEIEELEVVVVYYKNGEVVGADEEEKYHIASGDYVTVQFDAPYNTKYQTIEFDDYKLYINQAHNFNLW